MQVTVGYDYVLVPEWLDPGDRRTGAELHARLLAAQIHSQLIVCHSGEDVRLALANALQRVRAATGLEPRRRSRA
jgi:hypothetical protein